MTHEYWYLSRAAGFTAYLLLFASVVLGMVLSTRLGKRLVPRDGVYDIHRFLSIVALGVVLLHVYALLGDTYFHFSVWTLSLPLASPYRAWQTAAGVAAMYALIIIVASFYVRRFIGFRAWRALHFLTFALFALAALHGVTAGTDTGAAWARAIYLFTGASVLLLVLYRASYAMPRGTMTFRIRAGAAATAITVALALLFGTGLMRDSGARVDETVAVASSALITPDFAGTIRGTYARTSVASGTRLTLEADATGGLPAHLSIELVSARASTDDGDDDDDDNDGSGAVIRNRVRLTDVQSAATLCEGKLTSLSNGRLGMECTGSGPLSGVRIAISSRIDAHDGTFSGPLTGTMRRIS